MAATTSNKVFEELMVNETARPNIPSQCAGLGGQGVAIGSMRCPPLTNVRRTVPVSLRGSFHSEKTEEKTRRKPGLSLMKRRARKNSHSGTQGVGKSLSTGSGFNGADISHSSPGILDVYGIKTKPVDLMPYMAEISLKDLLTEEYGRPQPIHEILKTPKKESKDSFYPEANRILQCCLKWPGKAALLQEIDAGATLNMIDRGQCSMDPGHASKFSSQSETHVFAKNSVEILSMKTISCSKVTRNFGFFQAGALISGNPNMLYDLEEKNAFSVDSLPLKPFGDCVKSLKLSDCESLDNLIAQVSGSGIVDWSVIAGCSNKRNEETIPPLPFSHPPVWTLKADVEHERSILKGKLVQIKAIKQMTDTKEPLQEDSSEYYFSKQLKGGKGAASRSVKHEARQVLQGPTSLTELEHCCDKYLCHFSSSVPVEVIPPEAFTAACTLFHMANELPFPSLGTSDKKTGRRSLQMYPGVPCQRPAKSLNVGPSAAFPCHITNRQGDAINKPNRSLMPSKFPLGERKKALSLVGNSVITPANLPVRTIPRCTGGIPSAPMNPAGVSGVNRFLMWSEKDGQISSRGNNRVSGRGPAPRVVSPPTKTGLKTVLKSSRKA